MGNSIYPCWVTGLISVAITLIFTGFAGYVVFKTFQTSEPGFASVASLLLAGLTSFLGIMNILSITSKMLGIENAAQPFGLPEGTVRSILTIAFIVMISVLAGYLVIAHNGKSSWTAASRIVLKPCIKANSDAETYAQQQRTQIPPMNIVTVERLSSEERAALCPKDTPEPAFRVALYPHLDHKLTEDISKQILTILSTILAGMIGFYFAARSNAGASNTANAGKRAESLAQLMNLVSNNSKRKDAIAGLRERINQKLSNDGTADEQKPQLEAALSQLENIESMLDEAWSIGITRNSESSLEEIQNAVTKVGSAVEKLEKLNSDIETLVASSA